MKVRFWGVRGSLPAPLAAEQVKSKISAILQRAKPSDLESASTREKFLAHLPPWLFGTVGGNTPCIEITTNSKDTLVFDAGSGLRELGIQAVKRQHPPKTYNIFFSHLHWDHIQGLPFFNPGYDPNISLNFYSPDPWLEETLTKQMLTPTFPIPIGAMGAAKTYTKLEKKINIGTVQIDWRKMNHPGGSWAYSITEGLKRIVYATDSELVADDFVRDDEHAAIFGGADAIIIDAQYTLGEAIEKYNWGHSAFSMALEFASNWGIGKVILFHHDPTSSDKKLYNMLQSARWFTEHMSIKGVEIILAYEGLEIDL